MIYQQPEVFAALPLLIALKRSLNSSATVFKPGVYRYLQVNA
ncbi:MAG: hypothetical protein V7K17_30890 [Nostoc sp.]